VIQEPERSFEFSSWSPKTPKYSAWSASTVTPAFSLPMTFIVFPCGGRGDIPRGGALLIAVAAIAGYIPAWKASRIDPMVALRSN
jgi:hypothetical protein